MPMRPAPSRAPRERRSVSSFLPRLRSITTNTNTTMIAPAPASDNVVEPVAASLFTDYLVAFELTSIVLLVAVVGAVLLAKKRVQA